MVVSLPLSKFLRNFPENVEVQWKGLEALHMLTKYRKLAGVLSQQNGGMLQFRNCRNLSEKDVDETENKKKKTMFKDGVEVEVPAAKTGKKKPLKGRSKGRVLEEALQTLVR